MQKNVLSFTVIVVGIIILLGSLFADLIGIGTPGFGYGQTKGAVIGAIIGIIGFVLYRFVVYQGWGRKPQAEPLYNNKMGMYEKIRRSFTIRLIHRVDYFFFGFLLGLVLGAAIVILLFSLVS